MAAIFQLEVLISWALAMVFGLFIGATPGLTATMAVALVTPLTFQIADPTIGLAILIGVSFTAIYAGDLPATFLRIPGTPASAAAMLDGYPLAQQGRGAFAAQINLLCAALGGLIGVGILSLAAPQVARFALRFSSFEYFWMAVLGLSISALVSPPAAARGAFAASLGILLSTVGLDQFGGANQRYTFGIEALYDGIPFIPAMIGLFGLSEALRSAGGTSSSSDTGVRVEPASWKEGLGAIRARWALILRSSGLGAIIGALPGAGADIAAWGAYGMAKKTHGRSEAFGKGSVSGVVGPSSANNAAVAGAWIPALVFGIPGDAVTAIVLGAFLMYGLRPGPFIFEEEPERMGQILTIAAVTQLLLIPAGMLGLRVFRTMMRAPRAAILTGVVVFSVVGSYALRRSLSDVWIMVAFGVLGWALERRRVPLAPLILGLILGPQIEENFRAGLIKSDGSLWPFFTRPISAVLFGVWVSAALIAMVGAARRSSPGSDPRD